MSQNCKATYNGNTTSLDCSKIIGGIGERENRVIHHQEVLRWVNLIFDCMDAINIRKFDCRAPPSSLSISLQCSLRVRKSNNSLKFPFRVFEYAMLKF